MKQLRLGSQHRDANPAPQSLPRLRMVRCPSVCSTAAIRCRRYSPERAMPSSRSVAGSKACYDHDRATLCGPARPSSGPRVRTSAAQSSRAASRPLTLALPRHPGQHRDQMQAPPGQLLLPGAVSGELYSDGRAPPSSAIFAFSAAKSKSSHILRNSGRSTPSCPPPLTGREPQRAFISPSPKARNTLRRSIRSACTGPHSGVHPTTMLTSTSIASYQSVVASRIGFNDPGAAGR